MFIDAPSRPTRPEIVTPIQHTHATPLPASRQLYRSHIPNCAKPTPCTDHSARFYELLSYLHVRPSGVRRRASNTKRTPGKGPKHAGGERNRRVGQISWPTTGSTPRDIRLPFNDAVAVLLFDHVSGVAQTIRADLHSRSRTHGACMPGAAPGLGLRIWSRRSLAHLHFDPL